MSDDTLLLLHADREIGNDDFVCEWLNEIYNGRVLLDRLTFTMEKGDTIAFVGENEMAATALFDILSGESEPDGGTFKWGITTTQSYLPKDNTSYFENKDISLVDWLRQYSKDQNETYIRGFLGRMLFSGEEALKATVLRRRKVHACCRKWCSGSNILILRSDKPSWPRSITAVNEGVKAFKDLFCWHLMTRIC